MSSITSVSTTTASSYDALAQLLSQAAALRKNSLFDTMGSSSTSTAQAGDSVSLSSDSSQSDISNYLQQLEDLRTSDPDQYKKVTAQLAAKFEEAAANETDPGKKQFLTDMASSFSKASSEGTKFEMPKPPGGHGPQGAPPPPPDADADSTSSDYTLASLFSTQDESDSSSSSSLLSLFKSSSKIDDASSTLASIFESVLGK